MTSSAHRDSPRWLDSHTRQLNFATYFIGPSHCPRPSRFFLSVESFIHHPPARGSNSKPRFFFSYPQELRPLVLLIYSPSTSHHHPSLLFLSIQRTPRPRTRRPVLRIRPIPRRSSSRASARLDREEEASGGTPPGICIPLSHPVHPRILISFYACRPM